MNPFILTAMDYPEVTSRGLYPKSNDECLYIITFKDTPYTGMFRIDLIAPTTWHYDKELPNQSYFQKSLYDISSHIVIVSKNARRSSVISLRYAICISISNRLLTYVFIRRS